VFGRQEFLNNGQTVKADEAYIRESIINPQAKLVNGFGPIMPTFQGQISEEQLVQILAYIKSLPAAGGQATAPSAVPASAPSPARAASPGSNR
jgi:cytochrome c oxidase subunit 2